MTEPAGIEPEQPAFDDEFDELRELTVRKVSAIMQIPDELLHPERYPRPVVTWRDRARWRWWEVKDRLSLAWEALRKGRDGIHANCDY